jgi:hypothetical protein
MGETTGKRTGIHIYVRRELTLAASKCRESQTPFSLNGESVVSRLSGPRGRGLLHPMALPEWRGEKPSSLLESFHAQPAEPKEALSRRIPRSWPQLYL